MTTGHNTTLPGKHLQISGDFAGYAQLQIERAHSGVQAMFMQGCAGDANPFPRGSEEIASLHGRALGDEVLRVLNTDLQPVKGPLCTALRQVELPLADPFPVDMLTGGKAIAAEAAELLGGETEGETEEIGKVSAAVAELVKYSLVTRREDAASRR